MFPEGLWCDPVLLDLPVELLWLCDQPPLHRLAMVGGGGDQARDVHQEARQGQE